MNQEFGGRENMIIESEGKRTDRAFTITLTIQDFSHRVSDIKFECTTHCATSNQWFPHT